MDAFRCNAMLQCYVNVARSATLHAFTHRLQQFLLASLPLLCISLLEVLTAAFLAVPHRFDTPR